MGGDSHVKNRSNYPVAWQWLVFAMAVAHLGLANGFRNPPDSASALGKAGGRLAYSDDASAITSNPANLVDLASRQLLQSLTLGYSRHEATLSNGNSSSTEDNLKMLPNLFLASPYGENAAIGLGITTPYGQSTVWPEDGVFQYSAPYFAEMRLVNLNPTYAKRLSETFAVGIGLDVYLSDLSFDQHILWPDSTQGEMEFYGSGYGVGGNLGLTWEFAERQRLALTYRSPVRVKYRGHMDVERIPGFLAGTIVPTTDFETVVQFPATVGLGYGIEVKEGVFLTADLEWVEFSRFDKLDVETDANQALVPPGGAIDQDWKDVWTWGVGLEWVINPTWRLRGGWNYLPTPIPDHSHSPTIPDADRHVLTVGFGWRHGVHSIDVAYAYSIFSNRDVTHNDNPSYNADYDLDAQLLAITYGWSF